VITFCCSECPVATVLLEIRMINLLRSVGLLRPIINLVSVALPQLAATGFQSGGTDFLTPHFLASGGTKYCLAKSA